MNEHRTVSRHRVLKAGTIEFGGSGIDCTVRNISPRGAALDVASPFGIPDTFELSIPTEHGRHPCRVIWRKQKRIGVVFSPT